MNTKPQEEFYDLKNDPYEVHNLAEDPKYSKKIEEYRLALKDWQLEIGDKGFIPEHDLIESFWPEMKQPITQNVTFEKDKTGTLKLNSSTVGASIGYQIGDDIGTNHWNLYYKPIAIDKNQKIIARAIRIGYKASEITSY